MLLMFKDNSNQSVMKNVPVIGTDHHHHHFLSKKSHDNGAADDSDNCCNKKSATSAMCKQVAAIAFILGKPKKLVESDSKKDAQTDNNNNNNNALTSLPSGQLCRSISHHSLIDANNNENNKSTAINKNGVDIKQNLTRSKSGHHLSTAFSSSMSCAKMLASSVASAVTAFDHRHHIFVVKTCDHSNNQHACCDINNNCQNNVETPPNCIISQEDVRYKSGVVMASPNDEHKDHAHTKWGYGSENGPHTWSKHFPAGLGGHQSPINIDTSSANVRYDGTMPTLKMHYEPLTARTLKNTGHSFQLNFAEESNNVLSGGPLESNYHLVQIHAHWSVRSDRGSEHTLNGRAYPGELHFVHYNKDKYANIGEAIQYSDGLAVLAVFLKLGQRNTVLNGLIDDFNRIRYCDQEVVMNNHPVDIRHMMPANTERFYTYNGSLTTPPLLECVTWIVFDHALEISPDQVQAFRELYRVPVAEKQPTVNQLLEVNFRPTMPINDRVVRASFRC